MKLSLYRASMKSLIIHSFPSNPSSITASRLLAVEQAFLIRTLQPCGLRYMPHDTRYYSYSPSCTASSPAFNKCKFQTHSNLSSLSRSQPLHNPKTLQCDSTSPTTNDNTTMSQPSATHPQTTSFFFPPSPSSPPNPNPTESTVTNWIHFSIRTYS